jgi:hypothetical protein
LLEVVRDGLAYIDFSCSLSFTIRFADLSLSSIDALDDVLSSDSLRVESEDVLLTRLCNSALHIRAFFVPCDLSCSAGKAFPLLPIIFQISV